MNTAWAPGQYEQLLQHCLPVCCCWQGAQDYLGFRCATIKSDFATVFLGLKSNVKLKCKLFISLFIGKKEAVKYLVR